MVAAAIGAASGRCCCSRCHCLCCWCGRHRSCPDTATISVAAAHSSVAVAVAVSTAAAAAVVVSAPPPLLLPLPLSLLLLLLLRPMLSLPCRCCCNCCCYHSIAHLLRNRSQTYLDHHMLDARTPPEMMRSWPSAGHTGSDTESKTFSFVRLIEISDWTLDCSDIRYRL